MPTNTTKSEENIYDSICKSISNRADQVEWANFTPVDWEQLVEISRSEGVGALLYWSFSRIREPEYSLFPQDILEKLLFLYSGTTRRNTHLFRELDKFLGLLEEAEINAVVLKGAALANTVYEDIGLRWMSDLDLLISQDQLPAAVQLANSIGYNDPYPDAGPGLKKLLAHDIYLERTEYIRYQLELHTSIVASEVFKYSVPVDWFWAQTEPFSFGRTIKNRIYNEPQHRKTFKLTPTAQLLHSAAHMMLQHSSRNTPMIWLYDIDRLVQVERDRIDWPALVNQAREFQWEPALYEALQQAQLKFNTPVPDELKIQTNGGKNTEISYNVKIKGQPSQTCMQSNWKKIFSLNWHGRVRLIQALILPSPAYMRWRYQLKAPGPYHIIIYIAGWTFYWME